LGGDFAVSGLTPEKGEPRLKSLSLLRRMLSLFFVDEFITQLT